MKKYVNGVLTDMTAEEISARQAEVKAAKQIHTARNAEAETSETKKASGKQKLLDLGLSEEEVKALIGI